MAVAATQLVEGRDRDPRGGEPAPRPVDLVHLAKYTLGNRDLEHEVLTLFTRQSDLYLARLREARDTRAWVEAAHTLKGSARGIGAWHVAEAAEQAEYCADTSARNRLADVLADRLAEANRFIRDLLACA